MNKDYPLSKSKKNKHSNSTAAADLDKITNRSQASSLIQKQLETQDFNEYVGKSFYRSKGGNRSYMISRQDQMIEPAVNYTSFEEGKSTSKTYQNMLVIENESDKSLPIISIANKSLLDSFKDLNSPDPHERMSKNIKLKKNTLVKSEQIDLGKHKRTSTNNLPKMNVIENDHYQLNQINEFKALKDTLKANIKYYKALINSKEKKKSSDELLDPSLQSIQITVDKTLKTSK